MCRNTRVLARKKEKVYKNNRKERLMRDTTATLSLIWMAVKRKKKENWLLRSRVCCLLELNALSATTTQNCTVSYNTKQRKSCEAGNWERVRWRTFTAVLISFLLSLLLFCLLVVVYSEWKTATTRVSQVCSSNMTEHVSETTKKPRFNQGIHARTHVRRAASITIKGKKRQFRQVVRRSNGKGRRKKKQEPTTSSSLEGRHFFFFGKPTN